MISLSVSYLRFAVMEWPSSREANKPRVHFEYGLFPTYAEAQKKSKDTGNPRCFPKAYLPGE